MTAGAETIGPQETLEAAVRRMKERGVGALAVCEGDDDELVGVITERDVERAIALGLDPARAAVHEVMTTDVEHLRAPERPAPGPWLWWEEAPAVPP